MTINRFGLIGDIHAEDEFLTTALDHLALQDLDAILCVGDIVDGRGDVDRCVELLEEQSVECICDNHDRWLCAGQKRDLREAHYSIDLAPRTRAFLRALPITKSYDTVAGKMLLCHGFGEDDMVFVDEVLVNADRDKAARRAKSSGAATEDRWRSLDRLLSSRLLCVWRNAFLPCLRAFHPNQHITAWRRPPLVDQSAGAVQLFSKWSSARMSSGFTKCSSKPALAERSRSED